MKKGVVSGVAKGITKSLVDAGKGVVYEAASQAGKIIEEGVEEVITGGSKTSGSTIAQQTSSLGKLAQSPQLPPKDQEEIDRLKKEIKSTKQGPRRDVEKEIKEVREKKKQEEEEKFLKELEEKRKKEEEEARKDAQTLEEVLPGGGNRPKRGSAFAIHRKQRKAELGRGAKN